MHAYSIHRDPRNFSRPDTFWPERWLLAASPDSTAAAAPEGCKLVHDAQAFIPFSHGPMNCVGKALALQQLKTAVCALMQRFAMRPREGWTLADYERVPVSQFGAALLRGMGWKEGTAASRKNKGPVEPYLPQSRPALLGIGAKEKEVLDDGSQKKGKGKPEAQ